MIDGWPWRSEYCPGHVVEREYFKVKKMEISEKMTRKSQQSGSSGPSDGNFSNCNEYDGENYGSDLSPY